MIISTSTQNITSEDTGENITSEDTNNVLTDVVFWGLLSGLNTNFGILVGLDSSAIYNVYTINIFKTIHGNSLTLKRFINGSWQ